MVEDLLVGKTNLAAPQLGNESWIVNPSVMFTADPYPQGTVPPSIDSVPLMLHLALDKEGGSGHPKYCFYPHLLPVFFKPLSITNLKISKHCKWKKS